MCTVKPGICPLQILFLNLPLFASFVRIYYFVGRSVLVLFNGILISLQDFFKVCILVCTEIIYVNAT
jgi:hypothetical protein